MKCSNCGKEFYDNEQIICEYCGAELISNKPETVNANPPKSKLELFIEDSGIKDAYNKLKKRLKKLKN
jgi:DNA-directed RNA polymerase subunit RPC12/RpoP